MPTNKRSPRPHKSAEEVQDAIFRRMSASHKLKLASDFYAFARVLNKLGKHYGTGRTAAKNRRNSKNS